MPHARASRPAALALLALAALALLSAGCPSSPGRSTTRGTPPTEAAPAPALPSLQERLGVRVQSVVLDPAMGKVVSLDRDPRPGRERSVLVTTDRAAFSLSHDGTISDVVRLQVPARTVPKFRPVFANGELKLLVSTGGLGVLAVHALSPTDGSLLWTRTKQELGGEVNVGVVQPAEAAPGRTVLYVSFTDDGFAVLDLDGRVLRRMPDFPGGSLMSGFRFHLIDHPGVPARFVLNSSTEVRLYNADADLIASVSLAPQNVTYLNFVRPYRDESGGLSLLIAGRMRQGRDGRVPRLWATVAVRPRPDGTLALSVTPLSTDLADPTVQRTIRMAASTPIQGTDDVRLSAEGSFSQAPVAGLSGYALAIYATDAADTRIAQDDLGVLRGDHPITDVPLLVDDDPAGARWWVAAVGRSIRIYRVAE
jgi:hypothetical protein